MIRLFPILWLAACAVPADVFQEEVVRGSCEAVVRCTSFYDSADACVAEAEVEDTRGCAYDAAAASACLDAVDALQCPGGDAIPDEPEVCRDVWTCE